MSLPKLAILLLRGLEGCGVTSYARHLKAYYDSKDTKCEVFILDLKKKIGRPTSSPDVVFTSFSFDQSEDVVLRLNTEFDLVQVHSVPPKSAGPEIAEGYVERILKPTTTRKVFINHDHSSASFTRNADYLNAIRACDVTLAHSLKETGRGFIKWLKRQGADDVIVKKLDVFFHIPLVEDLIAFDKASRMKKVICAGRSASWKRSELAFRLHEFTKPYDFITEVIGYERSIGAFRTLDAYEKVFDFWHATKEECGVNANVASCCTNATVNELIYDYLDKVGQTPDLVYSVGSYVYRRGLERIATSAFALHGRTFEHNGLDYGNNMEFQTLECSLLSVPVVHRHFLDTCVTPLNAVPLRETGALLEIDDDNSKDGDYGPKIVDGSGLASQLNDIWEDGYEEHRQKAVKLIREEYSTEALVPLMMKRCE